MPNACILIKTAPTAVEKILQQVRKISGLRKAYIAYGRWDIVAFLSVPEDDIGKVSASINSIEGVRTSETLPEA
jgi:hypothetical protein